MTSVPGSAGPPEAAELLERAVVYSRGALASVRPEHLGRPTPCPGWSLGRLLRHMDDSLAAMAEAASSPQLMLAPVTSADAADELLDSIRQRACALVGRWATSERALVDLGGHALEREVLGQVGALEIALHGWDVGQAAPAVPRRPSGRPAGVGIAAAAAARPHRPSRLSHPVTSRPLA